MLRVDHPGHLREKQAAKSQQKQTPMKYLCFAAASTADESSSFAALGAYIVSRLRETPERRGCRTEEKTDRVHGDRSILREGDGKGEREDLMVSEGFQRDCNENPFANNHLPWMLDN
jgi:hypothetical protein